MEWRNEEERTYNVTLKVNTPFKALPKLNLFGAFETEENFYHTKLLFNTNRSNISVDATTEVNMLSFAGGMLFNFNSDNPI